MYNIEERKRTLTGPKWYSTIAHEIPVETKKTLSNFKDAFNNLISKIQSIVEHAMLSLNPTKARLDKAEKKLLFTKRCLCAKAESVKENIENVKENIKEIAESKLYKKEIFDEQRQLNLQERRCRVQIYNLKKIFDTSDQKYIQAQKLAQERGYEFSGSFIGDQSVNENLNKKEMQLSKIILRKKELIKLEEIADKAVPNLSHKEKDYADQLTKVTQEQQLLAKEIDKIRNKKISLGIVDEDLHTLDKACNRLKNAFNLANKKYRLQEGKFQKQLDTKIDNEEVLTKEEAKPHLQNWNNQIRLYKSSLDKLKKQLGELKNTFENSTLKDPVTKVKIAATQKNIVDLELLIVSSNLEIKLNDFLHLKKLVEALNNNWNRMDEVGIHPVRSTRSIAKMLEVGVDDIIDLDQNIDNTKKQIDKVRGEFAPLTAKYMASRKKIRECHFRLSLKLTSILNKFYIFNSKTSEVYQAWVNKSEDLVLLNNLADAMDLEEKRNFISSSLQKKYILPFQTAILEGQSLERKIKSK
jgi:hypothetical protein